MAAEVKVASVKNAWEMKFMLTEESPYPGMRTNRSERLETKLSMEWKVSFLGA